ncbi:NADH dehydrogenase [ubiquinone] 1 beta subcomplex subunit 6 [Cephus cinctus]|uniref:NADH dehydrogenase [ubiquinone] 1 beta subcomplex subunit 6 n=1 Tax=Cephus cinctus TaxID=211228 RepID=A0AAJ7FCM7_CEPCN|nr:NADH dehydrogenase [ubiquinone] 1 beta subcomplex subunit 6 [Cephus cinctus]XP_024937795.1 NADH dehydrogenase [ubiquinone] 1 beta subcomplex subunit 6 [Cephus cinctus]
MESSTGGTKPMSIAGRMVSERERVLGMTPEERAWRAQYLKDQILSPDEPVIPKNYYKERYNVIRRFYRTPMDNVQKLMVPLLGAKGAEFTRKVIATSTFMIAGVYYMFYYFKYNSNDWTTKAGFRVLKSRGAVHPGDPNFPNYDERPNPSDYYKRGFEKSPL